ncbi:MAG: nitroreductase family protein [Candidatus Methanoplasma sp.]|jgi:nitroreductase|nr:nitroreductase family protein [Candidatus Methanoplasma sp.]
MNETLGSIYERSSVRKYKSEKVPENDLREILKAGFCAANGMNRQAIEFAVMENAGSIFKYSRKIISKLAEEARHSGNSNPIINRMAEDPAADIFYGAPAVIFVFAGQNAITPVEDGSLAVGNMMLAAHSMGYGTCFIGFAAGLGHDTEFLEECGVPAGHRYVACMIIGKPDGNIEKHPRSDVKIIKWIK